MPDNTMPNMNPQDPQQSSNNSQMSAEEMLVGFLQQLDERITILEKKVLGAPDQEEPAE